MSTSPACAPSASSIRGSSARSPSRAACPPRADYITRMASTPAELSASLPGPIDVGAVVRRSAPRLVRDAFGPLAMFLIGWKLVSLGTGIAAAAVFGVVVFVHERRSGRPAIVVRIALVLV